MLLGKRHWSARVVDAANIDLGARAEREIVEMLVLGAKTHASFFKNSPPGIDDFEAVTMAACSTVNNASAQGRLAREARISPDVAQEYLFRVQMAAEGLYISERQFGVLAGPPWRVGAGINAGAKFDGEELAVAATVRIVGPDGNRIERWIIGEKVSRDQFDRFREPGTDRVYALQSYEAGILKTSLVAPAIWLEAKVRLSQL